jgi:hypothetical protein
MEKIYSSCEWEVMKKIRNISHIHGEEFAVLTDLYEKRMIYEVGHDLCGQV